MDSLQGVNVKNELKIGRMRVSVTLPVSYRLLNGTPFDVKVDGLNTLFNSLPMEARAEIQEAIVRHELNMEATNER